VGQGQPPLDAFLGENQVVDSDRLDYSPVCLSVGAPDHRSAVAILGF
jgi:hypothetical protein